MKRKLSIILAVLILTSTFTVFSASAKGIKKIGQIEQISSKTDSAKVKWSKISSSKSLKYELKLSNGKSAKRTYKNISKNTYKITKLNPGKTYLIKVRAKKNGAVGKWSNIFKVTTTPKVTYKWSGGKLKASWTKVKDATSYNMRIELNSNKKKYIRIKNITSTNYTISKDNLSGLSLNKVYRIVVLPYKNGEKLFSGSSLTRDIEITGHRGRMDIAPENTMASFEEAYKSGYDSVEADFWETRSGEILICHNQSLTMCDTPASIKDLTASTIKNYPVVKGKNINSYSTQYLPTIAQLIKSVSKWKMRLYLHLKDSKMTDKGLKKIYNTIKKYKMDGKVTVFSSSKSALERIVKAKIRAGFLNIPNRKKDITNALSYAKKKSAKVVIFKFNKYMSSGLISNAHSKKLKIGCYNVSDVNTASDFSNMGADFLITNKYFLK